MSRAAGLVDTAGPVVGHRHEKIMRKALLELYLWQKEIAVSQIRVQLGSGRGPDGARRERVGPAGIVDLGLEQPRPVQIGKLFVLPEICRVREDGDTPRE